MLNEAGGEDNGWIPQAFVSHGKKLRPDVQINGEPIMGKSKRKS